jgi:flagellar biosynthesis chaperone FliJ
MKKFKFDLEKLLTYKDQRLENEKMILGKLNKELENEEKKRVELEKKRCIYIENYEKKLQECVSPEFCYRQTTYIQLLKDQIKEIVLIINKMTELVDDQIDVVKNLKMETKSLEIIKDNRYSEYKKEILKDSEIQIEEYLSSIKIMNAQKKLVCEDSF